MSYNNYYQFSKYYEVVCLQTRTLKFKNLTMLVAGSDNDCSIGDWAICRQNTRPKSQRSTDFLNLSPTHQNGGFQEVYCYTYLLYTHYYGIYLNITSFSTI